MERVKSLADLDSISQRQKTEVFPRELQGGRIIVGMGTCGIAAGAKEVLQAIREAVDEGNIEVNITETGCIGMCEQEPLVDVQLTAAERITYGSVTPELARKIVQEHVLNGRVVAEAAIARLVKED